MPKLKNVFLLLSITALCIYTPMYAQESRADSLLMAMGNTGEDTNRVFYLNELAWEIVFTTGDYDQTIAYGNQARELSEKISYKKGQAEAFNVMGTAYMFQGNYTQALDNYTQSLTIRQEMGNKKGIAAAYSNIGLVYMYQGDYAKSLKNHKASLKIEKERGDKEGIAGSYNNIGLINEYLGDYPEALKNYLAGLKIFEGMGDKSGIANSYNNIGNIYERQRNYKEALKNHQMALKIRKELGDQRVISDSYNSIGKCYKELGNYGEALKNHMASLEIANQIGNKFGIAQAYNNIGSVYDVQGDSALVKKNTPYAIRDRFPLALVNFKMALEIRTEIGDVAGVAATSIMMGDVYIKLHQFSEATLLLNQGLLVSKGIGNKTIIRDSYLQLSVLDSAQGNFRKSYENYKMYIIYRDSLFNEEKVQQTAQMQMQYEIEKDQLLEAQTEQKEKARIARRNILQYLLIFLFVFVVVGSVLLVGFIKVSPILAQGLTFVSLLLVFESVLVFTDPYLDIITGGVPIYKLLANLLLAILIFPIHNLLDRRFRRRLNLK